MKKGVCGLIIILLMSGCSNERIVNDATIDKEDSINIEREYDHSMEIIKDIRVTIDGKNYSARLDTNDTAQSFARLLPQEFNMNELNGNEKYVYLDNTLPTDSYNPKHIEAGDIMLYNNNCLVIFYKSFDTSYSYTKIGHIDNLDNLENNSVNVKFET